MTAPSLPSDGPPGGAGRRRRGVGRTLAVASAVFVLGMWAYVLVYHASGRWRDETPGRIADPAYGVQAEATCTAALDRVDLLPPAFTAADAAERADTLEASDAILADMLRELEAHVPLAGDDQPIVEEWLADWKTYLADRADFAVRLRQDPDARFYVTQSERDRRQITVAIDRFAKINAMPSCMTLNDVG